ncbi:MAG: M48 family metalloprotease [Terriglobales bacterium]
MDKEESAFNCVFRGTLLLILIVGFLCSRTPAYAEVSEADRALAEQVFHQLLTVAPIPTNSSWPPTLEIIDKDEINAFAAIRQKKDGSKYAVVVCYAGLIQRDVEGNADRFAYILGHELSHHILGHTTAASGETEFLRATFSRDQEIAADRAGMALALRANYSYLGGLSAIRRMIDLGLNYSSFEGLAADHPSWLDRIALLDKEQAGLWRSMSSFDNGVYFLLVQNYPLAERAFRQVTKDFPGSYEAWANLGYALLMQYADSLDTEDLRRFDVGQIVVGGFYRRPQSLEGKVRGINEEMWWDAVGALREAIRLKPDLSLAKANLGIAYLFRPAGKDPGKAAQLLEEASQLAQKDPSLDPVSRLTEQLNLAVAYAAEGNHDKAMAAFGRVEMSLQRASSPSLGNYSSVSNALSYNRAILMAESSDSQRQHLAIGELESYLSHAGSSVAWWPLAYQRYVYLCKQFSTQPRSETSLGSAATLRFRPIGALETNRSQVALGESLTDARRQLGAAGSSRPLVRGTNLVQLDYPDKGIKVMASDEVLAIILSGTNAPPLAVREMGLGAKAAELKIGMTNTDLDHLMGDSDYDFRQLADPDLNYRFYSDLGVAVLTNNGKVIELVIGQLPKRKVGL